MENTKELSSVTKLATTAVSRRKVLTGATAVAATAALAACGKKEETASAAPAVSTGDPPLP